MKNNAKQITPAVIQAAAAVLAVDVPEITPELLKSAIETGLNRPKEAQNIEHPFTIMEAAAILRVSRATVIRYLNAGLLRRVKYTCHSVKVDSASVRALLNAAPTAAE